MGRIRLILLDTRDEANSDEDKALAAALYGGDQRMRIQQELLLGVGGSRALRALGITPSVYHLNEGHSAFAILEWARHRVQQDNLDPWARHPGGGGRHRVHHPHPGGGRPRPLPGRPGRGAPAAPGRRRCTLPIQDVLGLGRVDPNDHGSPFLPTVLALKHCRRANGVSALHGTVARSMWQCLWPDRSVHDVPIGHITNGVHVPSWLSSELNVLLQTHLGVNWQEGIVRPDLWIKVAGHRPGRDLGDQEGAQGPHAAPGAGAGRR